MSSASFKANSFSDSGKSLQSILANDKSGKELSKVENYLRVRRQRFARELVRSAAAGNDTSYYNNVIAAFDIAISVLNENKS